MLPLSSPSSLPVLNFLFQCIFSKREKRYFLKRNMSTIVCVSVASQEGEFTLRNLARGKAVDIKNIYMYTQDLQ